MTTVAFDTPAFSRRDPDMVCWRVAAIYRCCLRMGMQKEWAVEKLREICPEGHRDHMADVWFANIDDVRRYYFAQIAQGIEPEIEVPQMDDFSLAA